jgi:hypothetical protein
MAALIKSTETNRFIDDGSTLSKRILEHKNRKPPGRQEFHQGTREKSTQDSHNFSLRFLVGLSHSIFGDILAPQFL